MDMTFSGRMRPGVLALVVMVLATEAITTCAYAQDVFARREQVIYDGDPMDQANIKLGSWGSGICGESTLNTYAGSRSIRITPKDLYAGGRIDFLKPVDLTRSFNEPDVYLQLVTKFWGVQAEQDWWAVGLGAPGSTDMYGGVSKPGRQVRSVRIVLFLEEGPVVECQADLSGYKLREGSWMNVSFPVAALKGKLDLPAYRLKRLVVTGDGSEPFHIGEIRTVRDTTPIRADAAEAKEVARNYSIAFQGFAESGASAVKYSWDFDKEDGIQGEAVGDLVYHRFTKAGDYVVTLTVSDVFGLKKPGTTTINVRVNE